MSELPSISEESIYKRLSANLASKSTESAYQLAHLELLAEALRNERDAALNSEASLRAEKEVLQEKCRVLEAELSEERGTEVTYSSGDPDNPQP